MSNPNTFVTNYVTAVQQIVNDLEALRTLNDILSQDGTLISRYFAGSSPRADINAQDVTNASAAVTQLLFTFDSGAPTQKSYMFKVLP